MANYVVSDTNLTLIADAIRAKSGHNELLEWPNEYKTSIENLNPVDMCIKTATDNIVSVSDAAQYDAKNTTIKIEPVQDLHGYDHPWPAGGGKNLYNFATFPSQTKNGITCTNNDDGSFTLNGTATTDVFFDVFTTQFNLKYGTPLPSAEYRLTGCPSGGSSQTYYLYTIPNYHFDGGSGVTFTDEILGGSIYVKSGVTLNNLVFNPMIRLASNSDDTFTPYSNICPISGWTGAKVSRTGKNLVDSDELISTTGTGYNKYGWKNVLKNNTTYTFSVYGDGTYGYRLMAGHEMVAVPQPNIGVSIGYIKAGNRSTFTTPSDIEDWEYLFLGGSASGGGQGNNTFMVELGKNTSPEYEPYTGQTYEISWESEAGTVYGGTLDVVNGVLTVMYKYYQNAGTGDWGEVTTSGARFYIGGVTLDAVNADTSGACNIGNLVLDYYMDGVQISSNGRINLCGSLHSAFETVDALKAYLAQNPLQLVYKLATPITYQLTPQEIALLRGNNTLWADTGDTTLTYYTEDFADLADEIGYAEGGDY